MKNVALHHTYEENCAKIIELAKSFPVLKFAPIEPWNPHELDKWGYAKRYERALPAEYAYGAACAVAFILGVWDSSEFWRSGTFEVFLAFRWWGEQDRNAFRSWAAEPWSR